MTARKIIHTAKITSVDEVLFKLQALSHSLTEPALAGLLPFNKAYFVVTSIIKDALAAKRFANPQLIEEFTVCFAGYYFEAINDFNSNSPDLVPAWAMITKTSKTGCRPAFIAVLMGANAHINYDLPLALRDTMAGNGQADLLRDLATLDRLIMKSGRQILDAFEESSKALDFFKRHFRWLYLRLVMYMVLFWRVIAWRNYKSLESQRITPVILAKRSTKIATRLAWLGTRLG